MVNWCEVTITSKHRKTPYHNAWITDWTITEENVASIATTGRCRWKIENENNNTLKTKGYHLEHNFGHGEDNLASVLVTLNILAFLLHSVLELEDHDYQIDGPRGARRQKDLLRTRKDADDLSLLRHLGHADALHDEGA